MANKIALVTGGSRGIGRAISVRLAEMGMDVCILYAGNRCAAEETAQKIAALGQKALGIQCDVADESQVSAAIAQMKETFGAADVLVNNAGITKDALVMRMRDEDFKKVLDTNLLGAFHLIRATYPDFLRKRAGRIINISSVSGLMGNSGQANYAAAKAGMIGLTKTVAKELSSRNITCNAVAPGFIKTDMTDALSESVRKAAEGMIPMKRFGTPAEVAEAVAFFAGDAAGYVTGTVLRIDGGLDM